jgi:hypothetical protein
MKEQQLPAVLSAEQHMAEGVRLPCMLQRCLLLRTSTFRGVRSWSRGAGGRVGSEGGPSGGGGCHSNGNAARLLTFPAAAGPAPAPGDAPPGAASALAELSKRHVPASAAAASGVRRHARIRRALMLHSFMTAAVSPSSSSCFFICTCTLPCTGTY